MVTVAINFVAGSLVAQETEQPAEKASEKKPKPPKPVDPEEELRRERESILIATMTDLLYSVSLSRIMMEIDEYERVAGIDESAIKRLQLAAKGSATQFAEKQAVKDANFVVMKVPPLTRLFNAGGKIIELPVKQNEGDSDDETPNIAELDPATVFPKITVRLSETSVNWQYREMNGSSGWGRGGGFVEVTTHPIWVNALKENTTNAHQQKIEDARKKRYGRSASDLSVAILAAKLRLDDEQRERLGVIISKIVEGEKIDGNDFRSRGFGAVRKVLGNGKLDGLQEVLTEAQWTVWKELLTQIESGNF
jgi:hypothetical protein